MDWPGSETLRWLLQLLQLGLGAEISGKHRALFTAYNNGGRQAGGAGSTANGAMVSTSGNLMGGSSGGLTNAQSAARLAPNTLQVIYEY